MQQKSNYLFIQKPSVYSQSLIIERSKKRRYIQTCAKN